MDKKLPITTIITELAFVVHELDDTGGSEGMHVPYFSSYESSSSYQKVDCMYCIVNQCLPNVNTHCMNCAV